ncbi:MAG: DNA repair protein RecO [Acidimicrobiia bacterium]
MPSFTDTGIVLRTYKFGEADRIVVFITAQHGQVRSVAKGVRKPTSKFGGRLESPSHLTIQFNTGKGELQTISQVESIDHFRAIRDDLDRLTKASALCEVIEQFSHGREGDPRLYTMLLGALRSLADHDAALLVPAFYLKLLATEGLGVHVDGCVVCGAGVGEDAAEELVAFDPNEGGLLCREHRRGLPVSPGVIVLLRRILGGQLRAALATPISADTHTVEVLARLVMEHHLERRLRAGAVIGNH